MNRHSQQIDTSYDLERRLAQSIDKAKESVTRSKGLRQQIVKLRRQRRQMEAVPQDVIDWFAETAPYVDEDEEGEGEEE